MYMKETWWTERKLIFFFFKALLLDIGADKSLLHTSECEGRPLIDLSNTPELSKIISPKPVLSGQVKVSFIQIIWCKLC